MAGKNKKKTWKSLENSESCWKWLEFMEMLEFARKRREISENCKNNRKWLEMAGMAGNGWK